MERREVSRDVCLILAGLCFGWLVGYFTGTIKESSVVAQAVEENDREWRNNAVQAGFAYKIVSSDDDKIVFRWKYVDRETGKVEAFK